MTTIDTAKDDVMRLLAAIKAYNAIYGHKAAYIRRNKHNDCFYVGLPHQKEFGQNLSVLQATEMLERYTIEG